MTNNDRILDELFRSKLENFEQDPPSHVWMKIQEKQRAGHRDRRMFFYRASGIAAALILAFLLGWQLRESQKAVHQLPIVQIQEVYPKTDRVPDESPAQNETGMIVPNTNRNENPDYANWSEAEIPEGNRACEIREANSIRPEKNKLFTDEIRPKAENVSGHERKPSFRTPGPDKSSALLLIGGNQKQPQKDKQLDGQQTGIAEKSTEPAVPDLAGAGSDSSLAPGPLEEKSAEKSDKRDGLTDSERKIVEMNKKLFASVKTTKPAGSWTVGAQISPSFSVNETSYGDVYASNMSRPGDKQALSLGGAVLVEYRRNRWSVQSGLRYSRLTQGSGSGNHQQTYFAPAEGIASSYYNNKVQVQSSGDAVMNGAAGVIKLNRVPATSRLTGLMESTVGSADLLLSSNNFEQNFEYVELPLLIRYRLIDKSWKMHMLGGVSANMLVGNRVYVSDDQGKSYIGKTSDMSSLSYSASVGLGMGYRLSEKIRLQVEPQLKYYLQSLNRNPDVRFKPYSIGIYTGVSYEF